MRSSEYIWGTVFVVWAIGLWMGWGPGWPFDVIFNFLSMLGIGYGTSGGFPWA